jgi:hypothetical protein
MSDEEAFTPSKHTRRILKRNRENENSSPVSKDKKQERGNLTLLEK